MGVGVKGERTEQGVGDSNVKGKGLFEGLVDTQEELYCPNIPKSLLGHFPPQKRQTPGHMLKKRWV